ncbi:MAG: BTAD domain-containing putative transcriptional regulator [Gaiellales bacterium]
MIEFRILGPLEASHDGRPLPLGHGKQRALLAILLLHANQVVSSDRLIDELWGGEPPDTAHAALRNLVSQLRRSLSSEGLIVTRPPGYELEVDPESVDLYRFEQIFAAGREALDAGKPAQAAALLDDACALWGGRPLEDVTLESADGELARLADLRIQAIEERVEADLALGRHDRVIPELEGLIAEEPLRERLRELLMLALYRAGRQAEALEIYQATRRALVDGLGIEPGPRLQDVERGILTHDPSLRAPRPRIARPSRRLAPYAGLGAVAAAAIVAAVLLLRDDSAGVVVLPNSIAVIDPASNRVVADIPVGTSPIAVVSGEGAVWVASAEDQTVTRVDPVARRVTQTIGLGAPPTSLAVGKGSLWIATGSAGTLIRVDATSGSVVDTFDFGGSKLAPDPTFAVATGFGSIWVASGARTLIRVDPETGRVLGRIATPLTPVGIAMGRDAAWAILAEGTLLRVDPKSEAITSIVNTGPDPFSISADDSSVWVSNTGRPYAGGDQAVWRIDQATGTVRTAVPLPHPRGLASGAGAIWVANGPSGGVSRVDPESNRVGTTIRVGEVPFDVAVGDGAVWVTVLDREKSVNP